VTDAKIVQQTTSVSNDSAALVETVDWAAKNTDYLRGKRTELFTDTTNFEPWLHRSIRHAWVEHATRLDGLFNAEFSEPIVLALNTPKADIDDLRLKSCNADHIATLAKKMPNTNEFDLMRNAYVVSAVIRGYYHQVIARNRGEHLFRHPFRRNSPLPPSLDQAAKQEVVQYRYPITAAQSAFATIVLASAMRSWRSYHRPKRWIETIRSVRGAVRARDGSLASTNLYALSWPHAGQEAAVQAARTLGIACPSAVLNMMVDFAGAAGLASATGLALTACPPAAVPVLSVAADGVGGLIQPSKFLFGRRLERLAKRAPGAIDYIWDEPAK
jgi:hypothetical protein